LRPVPEENAVQRIRPIETHENRVNVVVQITQVIPAMIARVGTTALGPPARTRTGKDTTTITRLRRADFWTRLRSLEAGDWSSSPRMINGFDVGWLMVSSVQERGRWASFPLILRNPAA
jgi:hypothetical protein